MNIWATSSCENSWHADINCQLLRGHWTLCKQFGEVSYCLFIEVVVFKLIFSCQCLLVVQTVVDSVTVRFSSIPVRGSSTHWYKLKEVVHHEFTVTLPKL